MPAALATRNPRSPGRTLLPAMLALVLLTPDVRAQDTPPAPQDRPAVAAPSAPAAPPSIPQARFTLAAQVIPDTAVGAITLEKAGPRLAELRKTPFFQSILNSDFYRLLQSNPGYNQAKFGVLGFSGTAGIDPWQMFEALLGENLTVALEPGEGAQPVVWAISITEHPQTADKLATVLNQMTGLTRDGTPDPTRSREVDGVRGYQINQDAYYAVFDNVIAMTNRPEALERTIRLRRASSSRLSDVEAFQQARSRTAYDALLWGYVNVEGLRQRFKERWIPDKLPNGFAAMLFGGIVEAARDADVASADVVVGPEGATVHVFLHAGSSLPDSHKAFFVPAGSAADWSSLVLPRMLAQISLRRDFHELWTQRDKLVSARGLSQLSEFSSHISNLLGQLDFGDDFLAQTGRDLQFLSNLQVYDPARAPMPQFPAFGMTVPLENAALFSERLESAVMMAFSFVSMQAAQNDKAGLLVDVDNYKGHKLICARYPEAPASTEPLPQRYNFSPTAAIVKDRFVLGSTKQFIKDVIDAAERLPEAADTLSASARSEAERAGSYLSIRAEELSALLKANLEPLVAKKMLEENKTREQAEVEYAILFKLLSAAKQLVVSVDRAEDGLKATAKLELRPGAVAK